MGARRKAREMAVQALYQLDLMGGDAERALESLWSHFEMAPQVRGFATDLVRGTQAHRARIDGLISDCVEHWQISRLSKVDLNILRVATYEFIAAADTPASVVINEAIEIARRYGSEDSPAFVNGVLDAIASVLHAKERGACGKAG